jgi:hypothetical protein
LFKRFLGNLLVEKRNAAEPESRHLMQPRSTTLLLPPAVCAVLDPHIDSTGILPPNIVSSIVARIYADPTARGRLHIVAQGVMEAVP